MLTTPQPEQEKAGQAGDEGQLWLLDRGGRLEDVGSSAIHGVEDNPPAHCGSTPPILCEERRKGAVVPLLPVYCHDSLQ